MTPVVRIERVMNFCFPGIWRRNTNGMGMIMMATSLKTFRRAVQEYQVLKC
jgi:hypothetical protein